jgi:hypothetical protein
MWNMTEAACRLPEETLGEGVAMCREFVVCIGLIPLLSNLMIHIYSPET